jgi:hypothetical protein
MNPVAEVKTNPNPASELRGVAGGKAAAPASTTRAGTVFSATPGLPQSSNQTSITNWQEVC